MAAGYLTTHVLDTARGLPAAGLAIDLVRVEGGARRTLARMVTNADGRTDSPILPRGEFAAGVYELVFHAGDYLDATGAVRKARASWTKSRSASASPTPRRITMCRSCCRPSAIRPIAAVDLSQTGAAARPGEPERDERQSGGKGAADVGAAPRIVEKRMGGAG